MQDTLRRLLELQRLLSAFTEIERVTHRTHHGNMVPENDTEHSFNLAMTAWFLSSSFPELKLDLLLRYALIHDMVEVHAGDTYIYGPAESLASKHDRERAALRQLEADWPDFSDMTGLIARYEKRKDAESRFIYALDKIMPIMLIFINDGYTWKQEDISLSMLDGVKRAKIGESPEILPYYEKLHALLLQHPEFIRPS